MVLSILVAIPVTCHEDYDTIVYKAEKIFASDFNAWCHVRAALNENRGRSKFEIESWNRAMGSLRILRETVEANGEHREN